jgi:hypothetical protein
MPKNKAVSENEEDFLHVDNLNLDKEVSRQPDLYSKWARKKANKAAELEDAKDALELVSAKLRDKIRTTPSRYDIEGRVTVEAVNDKLIQQEAYQEAKKRVNELRHTVDYIKAVVDGLEQKKWMLGNAVELWQGEYFSDSKPKGAEDAINSMTKDRLKKRRKKLRKELGTDDD